MILTRHFHTFTISPQAGGGNVTVCLEDVVAVRSQHIFQNTLVSDVQIFMDGGHTFEVSGTYQDVAKMVENQ